MWINYLDQALLMAALAVTVNLLVGYAGQVSVAHAAFAGIGGYAVAFTTTKHDWPFALALLAGIVLAALVGVVIGMIALGLPEEFLILMTMAFSLALIGIFATFNALGGIMGITGVDDLSLAGYQLDSPNAWLLPSAATLILVFAICWRLGQSPYGRVLKGVREDSVAIGAIGKNVFGYKVGIFAITSGLAGLIGGMYTGWLGQATPSAFSFPLAMSVFAMVIVGGNANLLGSVIAGVALTMIEPVLRTGLGFQSTEASLIRLVIFGVLLIAVMILRPSGILPERFGSVGRSKAGSTAPSSETGGSIVQAREVRDSDHEVALSATGLSKRYGGIVAAKNITLELRRGEITALVGPNGAGKTTAFNLLTGTAVADTGTVTLNGKDITTMAPHGRVAAGLVRTFQDVRLFGRLTCLENVMLAVPNQPGEKVRHLFVPGRGVGHADSTVAARALEWLSFVGMADEANTPVDALSYGQTKMISVARTLATEADVLLLDEPCSGVDSFWLDRMLSLIKETRAAGRTICLVEHNLEVVRELADHAYFMELGEITAAGTIDELTSSARLSEAYFGAQ